LRLVNGKSEKAVV